MKLNPDCIRDVLLYLEENLKIEDGSFSTISLHTLQKNLTQYSKEDVFYSVYNLKEIHFIEGIFRGADNSEMYVCHVNNITYAGHQFLNTVRPQSVWDKTKTIAGKVGVHTLGFLESVAHDVAVELAKQLVNNLSNPTGIPKTTLV